MLLCSCASILIWLRKISTDRLYGGAMGLGNWTPSVEFNIFVDPEAAKIVLNAGIPLVMAPLNVTHQAQILEDEIKQVGQIDNEVAKAFHGLLEFFGIYHKDLNGALMVLHYMIHVRSPLIDETLFETKRMNVDVETTG